MRSRDQDHPGQHGETPSLLKQYKKLAGQGSVWDYRIPATQEADAGELPEPRRRRLRAVSQDCAIAPQPGQPGQEE